MDDIKLYDSNDTLHKDQLKTVKELSADITMKLGLVKYATVSIDSGKFKQKEGINLEEYTI